MNFFHQKNNRKLADDEALALNLEKSQKPVDEVKILEAVLFAARDPITISDLKRLCPTVCDLTGSLERLDQLYQDRGVNLVKIKNSYAFRTAPQYSYLMTEYVEKKAKLSKAARETLAIIAYNQPITRSEIESIRGVSLYKGLLDSLLDTGWISLGARRDAPGRPVTFITTDAFLDYFGLQTVKDMPNFQELNEAGLVGKRPDNISNFE